MFLKGCSQAFSKTLTLRPFTERVCRPRRKRCPDQRGPWRSCPRQGLGPFAALPPGDFSEPRPLVSSALGRRPHPAWPLSGASSQNTSVASIENLLSSLLPSLPLFLFSPSTLYWFLPGPGLCFAFGMEMVSSVVSNRRGGFRDGVFALLEAAARTATLAVSSAAVLTPGRRGLWPLRGAAFSGRRPSLWQREHTRLCRVLTANPTAGNLSAPRTMPSQLSHRDRALNLFYWLDEVLGPGGFKQFLLLVAFLVPQRPTQPWKLLRA